MNLSDITAQVNLDLGTTVSATWLESLVARAVRLYSKWAGVEAETTITTVAGEDEYDLPDDCAEVLDVKWWPSGTDLLSGDTVAPAIVDTTTAQGYGYTRPSEFLIDNANRAAVARQQQGRWREKNSDTLVLDPEPTGGGLEVTVRYLKLHALTGTGSARTYATIPDKHLDVLVLLTEAEYQDAMAGRGAGQMDFKQGGSSVTRGHLPVNLRKEARRLRAQARAVVGDCGAVGGAA